MMTEEQKALIEDNIKLVYKFCSVHGLTDEDSIQDIILHLCNSIHTFDPSKGAYSTWSYRAMTTHMWRMSEKNNKELSNIAVSLDESVNDDEDTELYELIGDDDAMFDDVINKEAFRKILEEYKHRNPETWERDMGIVSDIIFNRSHDKIGIAKKYHVPLYAVTRIFKTVVRFFRTYAKGEGKPMELEDTSEMGAVGDTLNEDEYYRLVNWIKKGIVGVKSHINYHYNSVNLSEFASKELGFKVSNDEFKRAMFACGHKPPERNKECISWVFRVSETSPVIKRYKQSRSENEVISSAI